MYTHFEDKILRKIAGEDKPQVVSDNYEYGFEQCIKNIARGTTDPGYWHFNSYLSS